MKARFEINAAVLKYLATLTCIVHNVHMPMFTCCTQDTSSLCERDSQRRERAEKRQEACDGTHSKNIGAGAMQKPSPPKGPFPVLFSAMRERLAYLSPQYLEIQKEQRADAEDRVARGR